MEVGCFGREEVGSESLVGVEKDSVHICVELGGHVLGQELNLVDQVSSLGALGGRGLLGLLVIHLNGIGGRSWLNLGNVEAGSEGGG